jgi:Na+/melibiose symporter-like transporter
LKNQDEDHKYLPEYPALRKEMLLNAKTTTNSTVTGLEQIFSTADRAGAGITNSGIDSLMKSAMTLALQTKFEKAKMHSFELMSHLEAKSAKNTNSKEHYQVIINNITGINKSISGMNTSMTPDLLDTELASIEGRIVPLTKQTPYTLLMMRVVEIGLPILLSLFSIFFLLRYTLTEKRSHEIKELIMQRNSERKIQPE